MKYPLEVVKLPESPIKCNSNKFLKLDLNVILSIILVGLILVYLSYKFINKQKEEKLEYKIANSSQNIPKL
jgi:hypothetical protein